MLLPHFSTMLSLLTILLLCFVPVPSQSQQSNQYPSYFRQLRRYESEFESRKTDSLMKPTTKVRRNEPEDLQLLNQEVPNYDFEYQVHGGENDFGHIETRRQAATTGKYYVVLPDFRRQVVSYYADKTGYHATITYEPLPRPQSSIDTLEQQKPAIRTSELRNNLENNQKEQRRVRTQPNNRDLNFSKKSREEVQHRKQTRETPAEQILYALAQFEEHRHRQMNRSSSRRSFRRI